MKNKKQEKDKKKGIKNSRKKGKWCPKRAQTGEGSRYHPRWAQKLILHIRTVKRNRNEIEAQKNKFRAHNKDGRRWKKMEEDENERKRKKMKKMKENERK